MEFCDISNVQMPDGIPKVDFYKKFGTYEICCSLFSACNLNCKFCFQDHTAGKIDSKKILKLPDKILEDIRQNANDFNIDHKIYIRIWGGELFFDKLPDSLFDVYYDFCSILKNKINTEFPGYKVDITWSSNGVFKKHKRVEELLKKTNGVIALSYDAVDRFQTDIQKDTWLKTLNYFYSRKLLSTTSITLTRPMIQACLDGDKYFSQIPSDIVIDVNDYIGNPNHEAYIPTDENIASFYIWCLDNHIFNATPIMNSINNWLNAKKHGAIQRYCYCKYAVFFNDDGSSAKNCVDIYSSLPSEDFYGEYTKNIATNNCAEAKSYLGLLKRGCFSCEHYDYCQMTCWTAIIFKEYKTSTCPFQKLFNYLENNPCTVNSFLQWRNEYGR